MRRVTIHLFAIVFGTAALASCALADTFGSGADEFTIDFVTIGNPGNPPDANPNPAGAVDYTYRIGKYEISEQMIDKANVLGGLGITKDTRGPDYPVTSVSWYEAAKFVNWLDTSTGSVPAYKFDANGNFELWQLGDMGFDPNNLYRNKLAKYFLPSVNEWHKAAYYDPFAGVYYTYPTGGDNVPDGIDFVGDPNFDAVFDDGGLNIDPNIISDVGVFSPYGTGGQAGNVDEWLETAADWMNNSTTKQRVRAGGSWVDGPTLFAATKNTSAAPSTERQYSGFRVAAVVPEPSSFLLTLIGMITFVVIPRQVRR
jgi:sulfatase modifying factor 1